MSEEEMTNTPLCEQHVLAGAKMVPFAGWNMPVQYAEGIMPSIIIPGSMLLFSTSATWASLP